METRKIEISKEDVISTFNCDVEKETKLKIIAIDLIKMFKQNTDLEKIFDYVFSLDDDKEFLYALISATISETMIQYKKDYLYDITKIINKL
jgi:hypothetical protein